ncbi:MAG: TrkA family potassium uptake protein [Candidatus Hydrogenedentota bacterium]|nr:MAG: TrkA family potassium uptake protein [Candidatus Hydrogenedentota bacterium]
MADFVVIGLSTFGEVLARELYERGANVLVIDQDKEKVQEIKNFVTRAVIADATDKQTLAKIIRSNVDAAVISLGESIERSVMITYFLNQLGIKKIVVKANGTDEGRVLEMIGASEVVFPEADMAKRLATGLVQPQMEDMLNLTDRYAIVEIYVPKKFVGKTLRDLRLRQEYEVNLVAVKQTIPEAFIAVPSPDFVFKESDIMVLLGEQENLEKVMK